MKISEITNESLSESDNNQSMMDLETHYRQNPEDDRLPQQHGMDSRRKPVLTLKHINKLKKMKAAQQHEREARDQIIQVMYGIAHDEDDAAEF